MSTSSSQLLADIAQLHTDAGLMHSVVHGSEIDAVTTEGGPVMTVAGAIKSIKTFTMRGTWATGTAYAFKDLYVDAATNLVYMVVAAHTATTIAADLAAGKVAVYQDGAFMQDGAGAALRTPQDKMRDVVSAKDFLPVGTSWSGAADVTIAIQKALNTGKHVFVPDGGGLISATLQMTANGQRIYGPGVLTATAALAASAVILASGLSNVAVDGLTIAAGNTYQATGVQFIGVTGGRVTNTKISAHGTGIALTGCLKCVVSFNDFNSAAINTKFGQSSSSDIALINGSNDSIVITGNTCHSSGGYAVQLRADAGGYVTNCVVSNNVIDGYNSYGIMLYRNAGNTAAVATMGITGCVIEGNTVKNVSGGRPNTPSGSDYIFGSGIYIQGAENFVCSRNNLSACNSATTQESLAPGAIGIGNSGVGIVSENMIGGTSWYGIYINDAVGLGAQAGALLLRGNNVATSGKDGLKSVAKINLNVNGNSFFGATGNGMTFSWGATTTWLEKLSVNGNMVGGVSGTGISIKNASNATVAHNNVSGCAGDGIYLGASNNVIIAGNTSAKESARGLNIDATNTGTIVVDSNNLDGNSTGAILNSPVIFGKNGNDSTAATQYSGAFAPNQTLPDGNGTPTVTGLRFVGSKPTAALTITDLQGGVTGDVLTIQANNANTKFQNNANILLAGSADFSMTSNSTLSLLKTAGAWVETGRSSH